MGMFKLQLRTTPRGFERLSEIHARLRDFSIPFANIIKGWSEGNDRKFARGKGAESTGVNQQTTRWEPLYANMSSLSKEAKRAYFEGGLSALMTTPYQRAKRRAGFPDWLMVRTGALRDALGTEGAFAEYVTAKTAAFGTPLDTDLAKAAWGNRKTRPTIFLDRSDRHMIRSELQKYLSLGEGYKKILRSISDSKYALKRMDKEFSMQFKSQGTASSSYLKDLNSKI